MTVSSTRNETKADRAHHLSKTIDQTLVTQEQKALTAIAKLTKKEKKEKQRDRSHEKDQKDHLEKEEEADPDLEFMSEIGHVHAEGQMHHVHGHKAKNPKAKTKTRKAKEKGKVLNPKAKTMIRKVKAKRKDRRTSITFHTKLMNGTIHFANIARAKTWQIVVGNTKFSNALDWPLDSAPFLFPLPFGSLPLPLDSLPCGRARDAPGLLSLT